MIEWQNVSFGYGKKALLKDISLTMNDGEAIALIGPNGAGKSTMLRLCARLLKPQSGRIEVDGRELAGWRSREFARQLAFLPQTRPVPALTVRSLVRLGRFSHGRGDREAVEQAIHAAGLEELAGRDVRTLSGGQRQRAYLAMLMAQDARNVLLDEPLTHLDIGSQLDIAELIRMMQAQGKCVAVVVHDLSMLDRVCGRAVLLDQGRIAFDGGAEECLRSEALQNAFGVRVLPGQGTAFERR